VDILKEKWTQIAAMATTVFAVCAAISALKGGGCSTKIQVLTTQETNAWAYFQSKSIKQHATELQLDNFSVIMLDCKPGVKEVLKKKLQICENDIRRYDREKNEIKTGAEKISKEADGFKQRGGRFGLAVMLLQIAIMLNSIGVLVKRRFMFFTGFVLGLVGMVYLSFGLWR
jgi:hypothetical protein